jgi:hypothetical protein
LRVIATRGIEKRRLKPTRSDSSAVSPDQDRATITSSRAIMPRSPWLASVGWTKKAWVPVEANVAAILRPICPLLPMPLTITLPLLCRMVCTASSKAAPSRPWKAALVSCRAAMPSCRLRMPTSRVLARFADAES